MNSTHNRLQLCTTCAWRREEGRREDGGIEGRRGIGMEGGSEGVSEGERILSLNYTVHILDNK